MNLTTPDLASLKAALGWWEFAEYFSTGVVFLGCLGEFFAEFTHFPQPSHRKHKLARLSLLLVIAGVAGEFCATLRSSELSGQIIAYVEGNASDAKLSAAGAARAAKSANESAEQAEQEAATAQGLAHGARQEADSFEADIVSARKQAAAAESNLADARRRAADALQRAVSATSELNRLEAKRTLTNVPEIVSALKPFRGTEYTFNGISRDVDSESLLPLIDGALQDAGWKRVPATCSIPSITFNLKGAPKFCVPEALTDGVGISIQSPQDLPVLRSTPGENLPPYVRAASSLAFILRSALSPTQEQTEVVTVSKGTSKRVFISVGRKN